MILSYFRIEILGQTSFEDDAMKQRVNINSTWKSILFHKRIS